jgi:hypothetical protein
MGRVIICAVILILVLGAIGCGEDESDTPTEPVQEIERGLSGDSYFNTKFGISFTNLPIDEWTVKAYGDDGQGIRYGREEGILASYSILLIEHVSADQFVDPDADGYLSPVVDSNIPYIYVCLSYDKGRFKTYNLMEELKQYAALWSYELESSIPIVFGNNSGRQAILVNGDFRWAETWFAKEDVLVRIWYWAPPSDFDKYFGVCEQILENMWLPGK